MRSPSVRARGVFVDALAAGSTYQEAAREAGASVEAFRELCRRNLDVALRVNVAVVAARRSYRFDRVGRMADFLLLALDPEERAQLCREVASS